MKAREKGRQNGLIKGTSTRAILRMTILLVAENLCSITVANSTDITKSRILLSKSIRLWSWLGEKQLGLALLSFGHQ